jgi:sugar/nucleoside kinase (ribokinase family)
VGKIVVVGSFVYDLLVWLPYFPRKGETLLASDFKMYAGARDLIRQFLHGTVVPK